MHVSLCFLVKLKERGWDLSEQNLPWVLIVLSWMTQHEWGSAWIVSREGTFSSLTQINVEIAWKNIALSVSWSVGDSFWRGLDCLVLNCWRGTSLNWALEPFLQYHVNNQWSNGSKRCFIKMFWCKTFCRLELLSLSPLGGLTSTTVPVHLTLCLSVQTVTEGCFCFCRVTSSWIVPWIWWGVCLHSR